MFKKIFFSILVALSSLAFAQNAQHPKFNIKSIDGKTFSIQGADNGLKFSGDLKGKVVLIEFWGTHCPPCRMSIPHYIDLNKKYKDKIAMLAIEVQMTPRDILLDFAKQKGINYNVFTQAGNNNFVNYLAARAGGWRGAIPFLLIFDKTGEIKFIKLGYISEADVEGVIKILLNSKKKSNERNNTKIVDANKSKKDENSTK